MPAYHFDTKHFFPDSNCLLGRIPVLQPPSLFITQIFKQKEIPEMHNYQTPDSVQHDLEVHSRNKTEEKQILDFKNNFKKIQFL